MTDKRQQRRELTAAERKIVVRLNAYLLVLEEEHSKEKKLKALVLKRNNLETKAEKLQAQYRETKKKHSEARADVFVYLSKYLPTDMQRKKKKGK